MNKNTKRKFIILSLFLSFIAGSIIFIPSIREAFDYYFLMMLRLSIQCFNEELVSYGIIVLIIQIIAWFIAFAFFYLGFFNIYFPRIRFVNPMRTKNTFARMIIQIDGPEKQYVYMKVKFTFFPLFDWYTLKLPNPKYFTEINYKRMPSSIDIHVNNINVIWNSEKQYYELSETPLKRLPDNIDFYREKNRRIIKHIGEYVGDAIHGDSNMMKDYYTMSLVMDENNEPIPKKMLKKPPTKLEKEIDEEKLENAHSFLEENR